VIEALKPLGSRTYATFRMGGVPVVAELLPHDVTHVGDRVPIDVNLKRAATLLTEHFPDSMPLADITPALATGWRDWLRAALNVSQRSTITAIEYILIIASTIATTNAGHFIF